MNASMPGDKALPFFVRRNYFVMEWSESVKFHKCQLNWDAMQHTLRAQSVGHGVCTTHGGQVKPIQVDMLEINPDLPRARQGD